MRLMHPMRLVRLFLRLFMLLVLSALPVHVVQAADLANWTVSVSIENDLTAKWSVVLVYHANVTRSDYFVIGKVTEVGVLADDDFVDYTLAPAGAGTSIVAGNIDAQKVEYRFRTLDAVAPLEDFSRFSYRFPVTDKTDNMSITVSLPLGYGLVEASKLQHTGLASFEPSWGGQGSDGRRIYVTWKMDEPPIGAALDISVLQEPVTPIGGRYPPAINLIIVLLVVIIAIIFYHSRKRRMEHVIPVLTESERKVMEIILREKKPVNQKRVVDELDYSKAKVSRIVQELVKRNLVESVRKGRTNLLQPKKMEKNASNGISESSKQGGK